MLDLVSLLSDLIALPSVNPMGRPFSGPEFLEYRVTDYLERLFRELRLPYERPTVEPKRDNILVRFDGRNNIEHGGPLILFEVHQDTVPVTGMTIEPWNPVQKDGRIYGRGSCDVKGGMSAMLGALARLAADEQPPSATVVLACTINEEHGFTGATALVDYWRRKSALLPRQPDLAIVAEPTELNVVVAHKGVVRWRCNTHGRAAHSSSPQLGENAIFKMAPVLQSLQRYQKEVVPGLASHPLCGTPTLSVGTITGGLSVNTVPDLCTIEIDRRLVPGEDPAVAYQDAKDFVAAQSPGSDAQHERPMITTRGLSDAANSALADRLQAVATRAGTECAKIGVPYGTDASALSAAGVPCVVFGPGSIAQAHTADEWLEIEELHKASEILYQFVRSFDYVASRT
jgi:acetylornithine deacetylase/succinyl-diaminopimelate desuccinylase family protein